jgi:hypothetical protein
MSSRAPRLLSALSFILPALSVISIQSALAQGTVIFNNRVVGAVVTHIYGPNPADIYAYQSGNGTDDTPAGTVDWSAYPLLSGSGFTAELWAAPGLSQPESSLQPASPTTTFRSGPAAGFVAGVFATMPNVLPNSLGGATVTIRVWDSQGGTITSWAMAQGGTGALGESPLFNITELIGTPLDPAPWLFRLQSFNIHMVPEPSTFALGGLGAFLTWLALVRRRGTGGGSSEGC